MLGKIVNGTLITPSDNERQKLIIANPTDEILKLVMSYKNVTEAEKPEYDENTEYLEPIYTETDDSIAVSWAVKAIETAEE